MKYDRTTFWLHVALAFTVSAQMMFGLVMDAPRPGVPIGGTGSSFFEIHRVFGPVVVVVLCAHWLWQLSGRASNGMRSLYPWAFRRQASSAPPSGKKRLGLLSGAVQGLGLVIATLMAATGIVMFFAMGGDGGLPATLAAAREIHSVAAVFLWIYLGFHLLISLWLHL
jgi:cytochrome b561